MTPVQAQKVEVESAAAAPPRERPALRLIKGEAIPGKGDGGGSEGPVGLSELEVLAAEALGASFGENYGELIDAASAGDMASAVILKLEVERFVEKLRGLPADERLALYFRLGFVGDPWNWNDVAGALGCNSRTARRTHERGLARLRQRLGVRAAA